MGAARRAAARAFATKCGAGEARSEIVHSSAALDWRSSMKARSARILDEPDHAHAGHLSVNPTARRPQPATSASRTSRSVSGSATLPDARTLHPLVDPALVGGVKSCIEEYQSRWSSATLRTAAASAAIESV